MGPADPTATGGPSLRIVAELLHPPVRDRRFWIVQAGILTWAIVHDVVLVLLDWDHVAGVPSPATSVLLVVPVMYAALSFGVRGGTGTALWATALVVPHWFLTPTFSGAHVSIEVGYLLVLVAVAVVVGQRVEREQRARQSAEQALSVARRAEARYYTLFEDQPAPVLITDESGVVVEANTAAAQLLGTSHVSGDVAQLLGVDLETLVQGHRVPLAVVAPDRSELLLIPTAHRLEDVDATAMVQIVLSDITEQHRRQEEQRVFARRMLRVQEDERRRLARELHDDPLQHLTFLTRTLDDLSLRPCPPVHMQERLAGATAVADDATTSLRKIIQGLRPPVLDDLGLVSALRQLSEETRSRSDALVSLEVMGQPARLNSDLELAAYRIAQEALSNVVRHARAGSVQVRLDFTDENLSLTITDDGVGIGSLGEAGKPSDRMGLIGMRERVSMAGGTFELSRTQPSGTRVHATMPLGPAAETGHDDSTAAADGGARSGAVLNSH